MASVWRAVLGNLRAGLYLGSETFMARIEELIAMRERTRTEPALQRRGRSIDIVTIPRNDTARCARALARRAMRLEADDKSFRCTRMPCADK